MNRGEKVIEVQNPRKFAFYSNREVGIFETPYQLFVGLCHRKDFSCEVFANENAAELNFLIQQYYSSYFLRNNSFPHVPLQLPQNTPFYAVQYADALPVTQGNSNHVATCAQPDRTPVNLGNEYWGVNALNGYCVLAGVNMMIAWMADLSALVGPWARSFTDPKAAYTWAQNAYIWRFHRHYDSCNERIDLPSVVDPKNPIFIDQYFVEREKRWKDQGSFSRFEVLYRLGL